MLARCCVLTALLNPDCVADQQAGIDSLSQAPGPDASASLRAWRQTAPQQRPAATPQRPGLSSSTATTAAGTVELGVTIDFGRFGRAPAARTLSP